MLHKKIFIGLTIILVSFTAKSQEVIASDGYFGQTAQGSLSWTMGEIITETEINTDILTQGFQQNYEDLVTIDELGTSVHLSLYPNPFSKSINLAISNPDPEYILSIYDATAALIINKEIHYSPGTEKVTIDLSDLSEGYYLLKLRIPNTSREMVKPIIKTH